MLALVLALVLAGWLARALVLVLARARALVLVLARVQEVEVDDWAVPRVRWRPRHPLPPVEEAVLVRVQEVGVDD